MHIPYVAASYKFEVLDRSLLARESILQTLKENLSKQEIE